MTSTWMKQNHKHADILYKHMHPYKPHGQKSAKMAKTKFQVRMDAMMHE